MGHHCVIRALNTCAQAGPVTNISFALHPASRVLIKDLFQWIFLQCFTEFFKNWCYLNCLNSRLAVPVEHLSGQTRRNSPIKTFITRQWISRSLWTPHKNDVQVLRWPLQRQKEAQGMLRKMEEMECWDIICLSKCLLKFTFGSQAFHFLMAAAYWCLQGRGRRLNHQLSSMSSCVNAGSLLAWAGFCQRLKEEGPALLCHENQGTGNLWQDMGGVLVFIALCIYHTISNRKVVPMEHKYYLFPSLYVPPHVSY